MKTLSIISFILLSTSSILLSQSNTNQALGLNSTLLGGSLNDGSFYTGANIAIDSNGDVLIAGSTSSTDFPATEHPISSQSNGGVEVFVARFSSDLSTLIASTYIGGSGNEESRAIKISDDGSIYVAGVTESSDFPITTGAYDQTYAGSTGEGPYGSGDVFIIKLSSDLSTLQASTFIGGTNHECCSDMEISTDGNIYISGATASTDFDVTQSVISATKTGGGYFKVDSYIAALDNNLENLLHATFIGGYGDDFVEAIQFNSEGDLVITGWTSSASYPTTSAAYDESFNFGTYDGFVSKVSSDLSTLISSSFIGGSNGWDFCYGLIIDNNDNIFVSGHTGASDYPTTSGAVYENYIGTGGNNFGDDVFVAKFSSDLSQLTSSTFLGGSAWECGYDLYCSSNNDILVSGTTSSNNFPVTQNTISETYGGGTKYTGDIFITRLDNQLSNIISSTYLGKSGEDDFGQIYLSDDNVYLVGATKCSDFLVSDAAYDKTYNGNFDVFVLRIDESLSLTTSLEDKEPLERDFRLFNNYPNPFNPSTTISFSLDEQSCVKLDIFNLLGEHISTLVNTIMEAGKHTVYWNSTNYNSGIVNSGVYFAVLTSNNRTKIMKMILQK